MKAKRKHIIITAIIITVIAAGFIAYKLYKKYKESQKLTIGNISLSPEKPLNNAQNLLEALQSGLTLTGYVEIKNYSSKEFILSQAKLDCLSPETKKTIAEQTNILSQNITISKNTETQIPLQYKVNLINILPLFRESQLIPKDKTIWQIITNFSQYAQNINIRNLQFILKGFIEAEGITLNINQTIKPYDK